MEPSENNDQLRAVGEKLRATLTPDGRFGATLPYLLTTFKEDWDMTLDYTRYGFTSFRSMFLAIPEYVTLVKDKNGNERIAVTDAPETAHINDLVRKTQLEQQARRERRRYFQEMQELARNLQQQQRQGGPAPRQNPGSSRVVRPPLQPQPVPQRVKPAPPKPATPEYIIAPLKKIPEFERPSGIRTIPRSTSSPSPISPQFVIAPLKSNPEFESLSGIEEDGEIPRPIEEILESLGLPLP